jgi:hypothetical protein
MSVEEFLESENLDNNGLYSGHPTDKWYYGEGDMKIFAERYYEAKRKISDPLNVEIEELLKIVQRAKRSALLVSSKIRSEFRMGKDEFNDLSIRYGNDLENLINDGILINLGKELINKKYNLIENRKGGDNSIHRVFEAFVFSTNDLTSIIAAIIDLTPLERLIEIKNFNENKK